MFGQRKKSQEALERLKAVVDTPNISDEDRMIRGLEAVSGLKPGSQLRVHCEQLIRAHDHERAIKLLEVAASSGGSGAFGVSAAIALVALVPLGLFVFEPFGGAAEITTQTDACASELHAALEAVRQHGGMGFTASMNDAQEIMAQGTVAKSYARDGARYTMTFRVRTSGEGCQLQAYRLTTRRPGETSTSRGNYGSVDLNVCKCE